MKQTEILNRKARHEYDVLETYQCGIVLKGSEVKSIKNGKANVNDAYCYIDTNNEVQLKNMFITKYDSDKYTNHDERRDRKLLLHKKEILKIKQDVDVPGITMIPLKLYFLKGKIKVLMGICKGRKDYDKREVIKDRDNKRELDRIKKSF